MTDAITRAKKIRLVVLDVDGVLSDGSIWTGADGELIKRFYTRDGLGIKMLQAAGIPVAILTGRNSPQTAARARELGIHSVLQGKLFKTDAWRAILAEHGVSAQECAYMGDDVPDIPVLAHAGLAGIPQDANPDIRALAHWISPYPGGQGAVRSFAELILKAQDLWQDIIASHYVRDDSIDATLWSSSREDE